MLLYVLFFRRWVSHGSTKGKPLIQPHRTCIHLPGSNISGFKDHPPAMVVEDGGALDLVSGDFEDDSDYEGLREEAPPRVCVENMMFD